MRNENTGSPDRRHTEEQSQGPEKSITGVSREGQSAPTRRQEGEEGRFEPGARETESDRANRNEDQGRRGGRSSH